ncbi:MAG TPA: SH3 domain-containing protein [Thermomicrobiales bacterium]|nr:SH3 domain-containing protein [Thermomicrobiales bacterium]
MIAAPAGADDLDEGPIAQHVHEVDQWQHLGGATYRLYGYREGLVGHTTANGHVIQENDYFVALPCFCALSSRGGNEFQVRLEYEGNSIVVPVWDVGPWNISDNYWDPPEEREWQGLPQGYPQAMAAFYDDYNGGKDAWGRDVGSPGGIDIGDGAFWDIGMKGSDWLTVTFLWLDDSSREPEPEPEAPVRWDLPPLPAGYENTPTVWWDERPPFDPVERIDDGRHTFIPETRHNIPAVLVNHWYTRGGWQSFGLPITEFFREVNEDGTLRFVQYFERQVLSVDLSGSTNPPLILGDLLGHRTRIEPWADESIAPFISRSNSRYFPETGHSLQNGFKAYWEANGGLMMFGFPLSEEWSEFNADGRKVVMQVFERARLEWWPDAVGTADEITRGLLTIELAREAGWLAEPGEDEQQP